MFNKKYSLLNQYEYMYKSMWNNNKKLCLLYVLKLICGIINPLANIILPAMMVGLLSAKVDFLYFMIICFILFLFFGLFNALNSYLEYKVQWEITFYRIDLFNVFIDKTLKMDYALLESSEVSRQMVLAINALGNNGVQGFFVDNLLLFTSILGLILYALLLIKVHILVIIGLFLFSFIQYLFFVLAKNYEKRHQEAMGEIQRDFNYIFSKSRDISYGKDIRLYQLQHWLIKLYQRLNAKYLKQLFKNNSRYFIYDLVGLFLQLVRDLIAYSYLIYLLIKGMSVVEVVFYLGVINGFGTWFNQITNEMSKVIGHLVQITNYRNYLDLEDNLLHNQGEIITSHQGFEIEFKNVSFKYPGSERLILDNISFKINSNEKIALVGVNGAGKSTLVKILAGLYKPTSGQVLINGIDITRLNIDEYFKQVAVLFQDSFLLSIPIANNITCLSDEKIDFVKLNEVIELSGLKDKINQLNLGYQTYLGKEIDKEGISLSGGEIQKLFLARCLYNQSNLIILDEPTASLDAIAEQDLYQKYYQLVNNRTSIFISHRLSSTRFCDRIFVLNNSQIVEDGSHDQLMINNSYYKHMFDVQSQYYVEEEGL